jgi:hypothetical protein
MLTICVEFDGFWQNAEKFHIRDSIGGIISANQNKQPIGMVKYKKLIKKREEKQKRHDSQKNHTFIAELPPTLSEFIQENMPIDQTDKDTQVLETIKAIEQENLKEIKEKEDLGPTPGLFEVLSFVFTSIYSLGDQRTVLYQGNFGGQVMLCCYYR